MSSFSAQKSSGDNKSTTTVNAPPISESYAPALLQLLESMLEKPPEDPLHPNTNPKRFEALDKLTATQLNKLKALAFDAISQEIIHHQPSPELQSICNRVMMDMADKDDVVWLKCLDVNGRKYDHRYIKVFKPTKRHANIRGNRQMKRKSKALQTVLQLLSFDYQEEQELLMKFAADTGIVEKPPSHPDHARQPTSKKRPLLAGEASSKKQRVATKKAKGSPRKLPTNTTTAAAPTFAPTGAVGPMKQAVGREPGLPQQTEPPFPPPTNAATYIDPTTAAAAAAFAIASGTQASPPSPLLTTIKLPYRKPRVIVPPTMITGRNTGARAGTESTPTKGAAASASTGGAVSGTSADAAETSTDRPTAQRKQYNDIVS